MSVLFLRLFRKVPNKNLSVKECYDPMGNSVSWDVSFRRGLRWHEVVECEYLLSFLSNIFIFKKNIIIALETLYFWKVLCEVLSTWLW